MGSGWRPRLTSSHHCSLLTTPAAPYGYRLVWNESGSQAQSAETWVDVPARARFALEGLRPNPATGPLTVAFSLASSEPATLEILDVTGRRLFQRDMGSLDGGAHILRVGDDHLPAGMYLIRLTQGARELLTRGAVVP